MNINQELDNIILRNNISSCYPNYVKKIKAESILQNLSTQFSPDAEILILGLKKKDLDIERSNIAPKDDLEEFLNTIRGTALQKKINKIIEIEKEEFADLNEEVISNYKNIILVSYNWHNEAYCILKKKFVNINILDIYDCFIEKGLFFDCDYYKICTRIHDGYGSIFYNKKKYSYIEKRNIRKFYLERVIFDYIMIRDFLNTFKYIRLYIEQGFDENQSYKTFLKDLEKLLEKIKTVISNRNQEDIIMNWVDAIQFDELGKMKYLHELSQKSIFFENAYTVSPWTISTYTTIFCKLSMGDEAYFTMREKKEKISEENSILLKEIREQGYQFITYGINLKIFGEREKDNRYTINNDLCPILQWNTVEKLLNSEQKHFILIHNLLETHAPYISGNLEDSYKWDDMHPDIEQLDKARQYVDEQLEFYSDFYSNAKRVYMSDHGKLHKDLTHTFLIVAGKEFKSKVYEEMFSYINFTELLQYVMNPQKHEIQNLFTEFVQSQTVDMYADFWKEKIIQGGFSIEEILGYRSIRSKNDMLIERNDGKEYYYLLPNFENNLVNDNKYQDRILQLRQTITYKKIDINKNIFFKNCVLYYKAIEKYQKRIKRQEDLVRTFLGERLKAIPVKAKIAVRGGGRHTEELLRISNDFRRIDYIIDSNLSKCSRHKNCNYLLPDEIEEYNFDTIIISSYKHREKMKEELKEKKINIIDVYDYLEKCGIICKHAFYGDEILEKEDFLEGEEV